MDRSHPTNERGPMVGDNLKVMKKYLTQLISGITDPHPLISCLDGKGVLAERHKQMLELEKCNCDKVSALINLLKDDCRGGFIPFVESLQETNHISLAKLLLDDRTMRVVLIGEIGAGKSALGNNLLGFPGANGFKSKVCAGSVTSKNCSLKTIINLGGKEISLKLLDTPGLSDVRKSNSEINEELAKCMFDLYPGPHVFCFVFKVDRITSAIMTTIENYKDMFGECLNKYGVIVFTNKDRLKGMSFDEYIENAPNEFKQFLYGYCGGRYALINNDSPGDEVNKIQELILKTMERNEFQYYTHDMFEKAATLYSQKLIQLEEERNKIKNENKILKKKLEDYEDMKKKLEDYQDMKKKLEEYEDQKMATEKELEDMKVKLKKYQEPEDLSLSPPEPDVPKEDEMMSGSPETTEPVDLQTQESAEDLKKAADIKSVDVVSLCDILVNGGYLNDKDRQDIVTVKPSIATVDQLVDILQHKPKQDSKAYIILIQYLKSEASQSNITGHDKIPDKILNEMEAYKEKYPLHYATLHSTDLDDFRTIVDRHEDLIDVKDDDGDTPIDNAFMSRYHPTDKVRIMIPRLYSKSNTMAKICQSAPKGLINTLFNKSVYKNIYDVKDLRQCLLRGGDLDVKISNSITVLHVVCRHCELDVVRWLIDNGCVSQVNLADDDGYDPMYYSCTSDVQPLEKLELLVSFGGRTDTTYEYQRSLLDIACWYGELDVVRWLTDNGCSSQVFRLDGDYDPMYHSCMSYKQSLDKVKLLASVGGRIDKIYKYNTSLLHVVCADGELDVLRWLIENGCLSLINILDVDGNDPIFFSCRSHKQALDKVKLLISVGAGVDTTYKYNRSLLDNACWYGDVDVVKWLINNGCKSQINGSDADGDDPIYYSCASDKQSLDKVKLLVSVGSKFKNETQKHLCVDTALQNGRSELVEYLVTNVPTF